MPANLRRTLTLTETQNDLIEHLMKELGVDASKAVRMICDYVIDNDPDIAASVLGRERRMKKLELEMLDERISKAKKATPREPIPKPVKRIVRKSQDEIRTLKSMSPEEIIDNYQGDLDKTTAMGRIARERIQGALAVKPELLSMLPEDKRKMFEPGGEQ